MFNNAVYQSFYFQYITNTTYKKEEILLYYNNFIMEMYETVILSKKVQVSIMILQQSHFLYITIYLQHNQLLADNGNNKKNTLICSSERYSNLNY